VLDDILIERGEIAPFSQSRPNRSAMGRFGNVMLVNGETSYTLAVRQGEVVRHYLTNTANVRVFNLRIPGARMKLVGGDNGRVEHEQFVEEILIAPSERVIAEVLFESAGRFLIEHHTPTRTYTLGSVEVSEQSVDRSFAQEFERLRRSDELEAERARIVDDIARAPDKTLALIGDMPGMKHGHSDGSNGKGSGDNGHGMHGGHEGHRSHAEEIEWEDTMVWMNKVSTPENMFWKIVDHETGSVNHDIRVKIRIINEPGSDHPMQHPFHFHGQRFLVLSRNGVHNDNLVWKDTVLLRTGETIDVLLDVTSPGQWMAHCHIAEHMESGMMFTFQVY
jgi:FtsP/CotA-like multicopper oxidase with cupredoxin domain